MPRTVDGLMEALKAYDTNGDPRVDLLLSYGCRVDHCITKQHQAMIIAMYHSMMYYLGETADNMRAASNAGTLHKYIESVFTDTYDKRKQVSAVLPLLRHSRQGLSTIVNDYAFPIDTFEVYNNQLLHGLYIASPYGEDTGRCIMIMRDGSVMR